MVADTIKRFVTRPDPPVYHKIGLDPLDPYNGEVRVEFKNRLGDDWSYDRLLTDDVKHYKESRYGHC